MPGGAAQKPLRGWQRQGAIERTLRGWWGNGDSPGWGVACAGPVVQGGYRADVAEMVGGADLTGLGC